MLKRSMSYEVSCPSGPANERGAGTVNNGDLLLLQGFHLALAAVSAAVFASPVALPTIVTDIAGYLTVAGSVMGAVSQTAVLNEDE